MALSDEKLSLVTIIVTFVLCMFWLTMTDSEFARKNTQAEGEMLERSFGTETAMAITNQADIWYDRYIVANDLEEKTLHHFVPTQEERNASRGIETMGGLALSHRRGAYCRDVRHDLLGFQANCPHVHLVAPPSAASCRVHLGRNAATAHQTRKLRLGFTPETAHRLSRVCLWNVRDPYLVFCALCD